MRLAARFASGLLVVLFLAWLAITDWNRTTIIEGDCRQSTTAWKGVRVVTVIECGDGRDE